MVDGCSDMSLRLFGFVSVSIMWLGSGSSHPDRFPAAPPGDEVAESVVEPELEELASSRLSGLGGGEAGLPNRR
jgi:hypothetical protein